MISKGLQCVGGEVVVAVEEKHIVARCTVEPSVAGSREPTVGLMDCVYSSIASGIEVDYLATAIGRAIVDAESLPIGKRLAEQAVEAAATEMTEEATEATETLEDALTEAATDAVEEVVAQ